MQRSEADITYLKGLLKSYRSLNVRCLALRDGDEWIIHTLFVTNRRHRLLSAGQWSYGDVRFLINDLSGSRIVELMDEKEIVLVGGRVHLADLSSTVQISRHPSRSQPRGLIQQHPSLVLRPSYSRAKFGQLDAFDPLISSRLPSFKSEKAAALYYIWERHDHLEWDMAPEFTVLLELRDAWIDTVSIDPTNIGIRIKGTRVKGSRLEIRADAQYLEEDLKGAGRVDFPLQGLPANKVWVSLSRGDTQIDTRETNVGSGLKASDGIEVKLGDDELELKALILNGENEVVEFKKEVPSEKESRRKLAKSIAAFANGEGGVLIVGVEDDPVKIVGVKNVRSERDRLNHLLNDVLVPGPPYKVLIQKVDRRQLLVVEVKKGDSPPYGIDKGNPSYYVRRGASDFPATPEEVRTLSRNDPYPRSGLIWE